MKRTIRIAAIVIVVLVVVLAIVPFLIPANQFRPTIEAKASQALGRKVELGDLSFSLLSGSLSAQKLSIGDDPKFSPSPFLQAKTIKIGIEIMPLIFSRSLRVTGVTIENPEVTLLRNPAGDWNFSSLATQPGESQTAAKQPAPLPNFTVEKFLLSNGRVTLGNTNTPKRSTYDHLNVQASKVSLTAKFPLSITLELPGGGKFQLQGNVGPLDASNTALTPLDAKFQVSSLNLASTGMLEPNAGLGGIVDMDATLVSQNGTAQTKGSVKLSKALLVAGGSPAAVPVEIDFDTTYDLHKNSGVLNPSTVKIGNAVARLNGTFTNPGDATSVTAKLAAKGMPARDLQAFLPAVGVNLPSGASLQAGTIDADLAVSGPTSKLVTSGSVGLFAAKLAGFDLGSKMAAVSALGGLKTGKDLDIEKVTMLLQMSPSGLKADNILAVVPAIGSLAGAGTVDAKNNLDFKMSATLTNALGKIASPMTGVAALLGAKGKSGCQAGTTVPFRIQGTAADPKFIPDVGGMASGLVKSQLGCSKGMVSGAATKGESSAGGLGGLTGLFGKKKK
jgi:AsmA protein